LRWRIIRRGEEEEGGEGGEVRGRRYQTLVYPFVIMSSTL